MLSRTLIGTVLIAVCSSVSTGGYTQESATSRTDDTAQPAPRSADDEPLIGNRKTERIDPEDFVESASEKGVAEIELARVATDKGSAPVKEFAQRMTKDHRAINLKLKSIADENDIAVSDATTLLDKARKIHLEIHSDSSFDHAYAENQVRSHEETIELFERAATSGHEQLSSFAQETLPTLKVHLEMARELQRKLGEDG